MTALLLFPVWLVASFNQELIGADSLSVGSPFSMHITSDRPISSVTIPDTLESFAVIANAPKADGKNWEITLAPLRTGRLSIPRLPIIYKDSSLAPDSTDAFRVFVLSVLAEGDTLLRDIKPLERYRFQAPIWLYILLLLIVILIAVYLLIKRPKKAAPTKAKQPIISPKVIPSWEKALSQLNALLKQDLLEKGDILGFHFALSEILRVFLEDMYNFAALEMTAPEIVAHISKHHIAYSTEIKDFLYYCDLVKFAKALPEPDEISRHTTWFKEYLQSFRTQAAGDQ
jgi:hypothetical protein